MARDLTRLSAGDKKSYEQQASIFGEAQADTWYDKHVKDMGLAVPPAAQPSAPELLQAVIRPSTSAMQARLGVGEFAPRPELKDVFIEEQAALEAQASRAAKMGTPTEREVRLQIATDLTKEGLSPIGQTSEEYKRRFEEEYMKAQTAERKAMEAVAPARAPRVPGFEARPPIATPTTIAKAPEQVETMGGLEAIGAAMRPQILETPEETARRKQTADNTALFEQQIDELSKEMNVDREQAKSSILDGTRQQFRMEAVRKLGSGYANEDYDAEAEDMFLAWLEQNLPDEYRNQIRRGAQVGGAGAAARAVGAERSRGIEFLIGAAATDKFDPEVYKQVKTKLGLAPQTDAVVESLPMTIVRDFAGLSRFVFNPLLDAAFYDVEPGTDTKINPSDYGFLPRERTGAKEQGAWGKSYIAKSAGNPVDEQLREIAVEIATGRSLGDDLAAQQAVKPEDESKYRGIGIMAEVALPVNLFSVPGKVAGTAGRAAGVISKSSRLSDSTADMFKTLQKFGEAAEDFSPVEKILIDLPVGVYNAARRPNVAKPLIEAAKKSGITLSGEMVKSPSLVASIVDGNRVSNVVAIQSADKYNVLRWFASGGDMATASPAVAKRMADDAKEIVDALTSPGVNAQTLARKTLADIAGNADAPAPARNAAKMSLIPVDAAKINDVDTVMMSRQQLRNSLIEDMSDTSLGLWSFLTPNVVATTKAAKRAAPELAQRTKTSLDAIVDSATFQLKAPVNTIDLLKDSVVQTSAQRFRFYENLFKDSAAGSTLSPAQYKALNDLVAENEIYKMSKAGKLGTFSPARAGRAIQSASEPVELRSDIIQFTKQIAEDVKLAAGKVMQRSFVNVPTAKYVDAIANQYAGFLEGFPVQFSQTIRELSKAGLNEEQIYSALMARSFATDTSKAAEVISAEGVVARNNDAIRALNDEIAQAQQELRAAESGSPSASLANELTTARKQLTEAKAGRGVSTDLRDRLAVAEQDREYYLRHQRLFPSPAATADVKRIDKIIDDLDTEIAKSINASIKSATDAVADVERRIVASTKESIKNITRSIADKQAQIARITKQSEVVTARATRAAEGRPLVETGALMRPADTGVPPLREQDAINAIKKIMQAQFKIDYESPRGKAIAKIIEGERLRFTDAASNSKTLFRNAVDIRNKIVAEFPEIVDSEAISQLAYFPRSKPRPSLPETVLAVAFEQSKKAGFSRIIKENRQAIYDDIAVRNLDELTEGMVIGGKVSDKQVINALNEALAVRLTDPQANVVDSLHKSFVVDGGMDPSDYIELMTYKGDDIVEAVNAYAMDAYRRSPGWMTMTGPEVLTRLDSSITRLAGSREIALLPTNMQADIRFIQDQLRNAGRNPVVGKNIAEIATQLERQSPGMVGKVIGDIENMMSMSWSSLVEGMLAGRVLPNLSYMTDNVLGAPLVAAVTNPKYLDEVIKQIPASLGKSLVAPFGATDWRQYGGYASKRWDMARLKTDEVAITTPSGQTITNGQLWDLLSQARLGRAGLPAALDPKVIAQMRNLTEVMGSVGRVGLTKQLADIIPSGRISVPVTVATNADMSFRQELFVRALQRGATPEEAAAIARETLLDYGLLQRVLPEQLERLRKPFLFTTFSITMSLAIAKGLLRGDSAENIMRVARLHNDIAKMSGVYAPGQAELESIFVQQQQNIGDKPATYVYTRDPIFGQIFWGSGLVENVANMITGGTPAGSGFVETFGEVGFTPFMGFMIDLAEAKPGFVPARQVAMWQSLGMWEMAQQWFDIEEAPPAKMKRGEPTFSGRQYRFKSAGAKQKFVAYQLALATAGWNRTINDYFNALVAGGYAPEGAYLARYYPDNKDTFEGVQAPAGGYVNGLLYMIARQRAVRPPTQIETYDRQIQTELRKLQELQFKQIDTE